MKLAAAMTILCAAAPAWAAHLTIETQIDQRAVQVQEQFAVDVVVTIEGQGDAEYSPPDFTGFDVVRRGTQHGQSFVMSFGSGPKVTSTTTYSYVLQAHSAGKLTIGSAKAKVGSEEAKTEPIEIQVGGAGQAPAARGNQQPSAPPHGTPDVPNDARGESVLLRVVPDKMDAYVGEQVILSVFLLSRVELADIQSLTQPQLEGMLLERDDRPRHNLTPRLQRINGVEYQVFEIARFAAIALREGPLSVGAFGLDAQGGFSFFSQPRTFHVTSPPIQITAKSLPAQGKPPGFPGINVGRYSFSAQLTGNTTEVGKPLTLRLVAAGAGNVPKLELPKPQLPGGLRAFDPETKVERHFDQGMLTGRLVREYLVVPNAPGQYTLPPLSFKYFDPLTAQYHDEKSPPLSFSVTGEAGRASEQAPRVEANGKRLAPPRISSSLSDGRHLQPAQVWLYAGSASLLASALASAVVVLRRREQTAGDVTRGARGKAVKRLRALRGERNNPRELYAELQKLIVDFLAQRFAVSLGTPREQLRARLVGKGVNEALVEQLLSELDNCDFARFAPGADRATEADAALSRAEQILTTLDREVPA
jgi:ribosomal protein S30